MIDKLKKLDEEFIEIEKKLSDPEVMQDQAEYIKIGRRHKELKKIVDLFGEYK